MGWGLPSPSGCGHLAFGPTSVACLPMWCRHLCPSLQRPSQRPSSNRKTAAPTTPGPAQGQREEVPGRDTASCGQMGLCGDGQGDQPSAETLRPLRQGPSATTSSATSPRPVPRSRMSLTSLGGRPQQDCSRGQPVQVVQTRPPATSTRMQRHPGRPCWNTRHIPESRSRSWPCPCPPGGARSGSCDTWRSFRGPFLPWSQNPCPPHGASERQAVAHRQLPPGWASAVLPEA